MVVRHVAHEAHADVFELVLARDLDGIFDTDLLAEFAGDALLLEHVGDLLHLGQLSDVIGRIASVRRAHLDRVEGTDVDAELAARAHLLVHQRLRDLLGLDAPDGHPAVVVDGVEGTVDTAHRAVDAQIRVDVEDLARCDRVGGADALADRAGGALLGDVVRIPAPGFLRDVVGEERDLEHAVRVVALAHADELLLEVERRHELGREGRRRVGQALDLGVGQPPRDEHALALQLHVAAVQRHVLGQSVAEPIAHRRHLGREVKAHEHVPVVLLDRVVAAVAPVALLNVFLDTTPMGPLELPARDLLELAEVFRGGKLARELDRARRAHVDDGAGVVEIRRVRLMGVRLGVIAHVEDFREVLAAGIAGDAELGFDPELLRGGYGLLNGAFGHVRSGGGRRDQRTDSGLRRRKIARGTWGSTKATGSGGG